MKKPVIGVVPLYDIERESYWMLPAYFEGLEAAGGLPIMLPLNGSEDAKQLLALCDGLLITGGHDVDPARYGQEKLEQCGPICPPLDELGICLLKEALRLDMPVLGICRGLQLMNACLGGSLWQDLPSQRPQGVNHRMERPYDRAEHSVTLSGPLKALYGANSLGVNSCHHQGIRDLAPELQPMAVAEDGLVEAVCFPAQRFVWAVQWHPEFFDPKTGPGARIFSAFVEAALKNSPQET